MPKVAIQNISLVRRYDWQNRLEFDPCRKIVLTKLPGPTVVNQERRPTSNMLTQRWDYRRTGVPVNVERR
jgi:hypothetical protein